VSLPADPPDYVWPELTAVLAIHDEQIAEHGGLAGLRDTGLLEGALNRPRHHATYGNPDIAQLAAVLAHGIATSHAFLDGNKRTSVVTAELFLELNGYAVTADDADIVATWLALADDRVDEDMLADWYRERITPIP
jgi:death on curing protein